MNYDAAHWLATITGYLFLIVATLIVAAIACSVFWAWFDQCRSQWIEIGRERERQRIANLLGADSYWFSEDGATMFLLQQIADALHRDSFYRVDDVRQAWRDKLKQESVEKSL